MSGLLRLEAVGRRTGKGKLRREKRIDQTSYLTGARFGSVLKYEAWFEGGKVVKYSLAYVNPLISSVDNGRILGYDNAHGHHHRHFKGTVKEVNFEDYDALVSRFEEELRELWRIEDGEEA